MGKSTRSPLRRTLTRIRWAMVSYGNLGHLIRQRHVLSLLKKLIGEENVSHVLDAGCGWGDYVFQLARQFPGITVIGLDNGSRAYQECLLKKQYFKVPNAEFCLGSLTEPFGEEQYELVYSVDTLEHIEDNKRVLANVHRSLKPGGKFIIHVPSAKAENLLPWTSWLEKALDRRAGHVNGGYEPEILCHRLEEAGFDIDKCHRTFAKWRGGLADEISISLGWLNPITLPLALCLAPLILILGPIEVRTRNSISEGRGIIVVATKGA